EARWYGYCPGVPPIQETDEGRTTQRPSDRVVTRIIDNVGFWRRSRRQALFTALFASVLLGLAVRINQASKDLKRATEDLAQKTEAIEQLDRESLIKRAATQAAASVIDAPEQATILARSAFEWSGSVPSLDAEMALRTVIGSDQNFA